MNRTLTIIKAHDTVCVWNGLSNLVIDGQDFTSDKAWQDAIVDEIRSQISDWKIAEESK